MTKWVASPLWRSPPQLVQDGQQQPDLRKGNRPEHQAELSVARLVAEQQLGDKSTRRTACGGHEMERGFSNAPAPGSGGVLVISVRQYGRQVQCRNHRTKGLHGMGGHQRQPGTVAGFLMPPLSFSHARASPYETEGRGWFVLDYRAHFLSVSQASPATWLPQAACTGPKRAVGRPLSRAFSPAARA